MALNNLKRTRKVGVIGNPLWPHTRERVIQKLYFKGHSLEKASELADNIQFYSTAYKQLLNRLGIETVNINYTSDDDKLKNILNSVDGVVFTGGRHDFELIPQKINGLDFLKANPHQDTLFLKKLKFLFNESKNINEKGRYFPVLGFCLPMTVFLLFETDLQFNIAHVKHLQQNKPICFTDENSLLKRCLTPKQYKDITTKNILFMNHHLGVTEEEFHRFSCISDNYLISSYLTLPKYGKIVMGYEHKKYPIVNFQFHVEKNIYDKNEDYKATYSPEAEEIGLSMGRLLYPKEDHSECNSKCNSECPCELESYPFRDRNRNINLTMFSENPEVSVLGSIRSF